MTDAELDALIVLSFFQISEDDEPEPTDDLEILTEEDKSALDALGADLIDRLLASQGDAS